MNYPTAAASISAGTKTEGRNTDFGNFNDRLAELRAGVGDVLQRLVALGDRLYGPNPAKESEAKPQLVASGNVGAINDSMDEIAKVVQRIADQTNRLENLS